MKTLQELIKEQTLLKEANLTILMDLAYDNDKEMQADMKKFGISAKFYKRQGGAEEYKVTGPKDKLKKYVLDWGQYSYDKDELEEMYPELFESNQLENTAEFEQLEEAINQFSELPASWKNIAMKAYETDGVGLSHRQIGKDSKIISKASKDKFKTVDSVAKFVKKLIDFDEVGLLWVEFNNEPMFAISKHQYGNNNKKLLMLGLDGSFEAVYQKVANTSGWRRDGSKYGRWVPPTYDYMKYLSVSDVEQKVRYYVLDLIRGVMGISNASVEQCDEFLKKYKLNISIKGLGADEKCQEKQTDRQNNKDYIPADVQLKIDTSVKYVKSKLTVNVDSIRSDLLKELDKFDRGEQFNFDPIIDKMNKLRYVMAKLGDIKNNKKYSSIDRYPFGKDWDLKRALEYAKELESVVK